MRSKEASLPCNARLLTTPLRRALEAVLLLRPPGQTHYLCRSGPYSARIWPRLARLRPTVPLSNSAGQGRSRPETSRIAHHPFLCCTSRAPTRRSCRRASCSCAKRSSHMPSPRVGRARSSSASPCGQPCARRSTERRRPREDRPGDGSRREPHQTDGGRRDGSAVCWCGGGGGGRFRRCKVSVVARCLLGQPGARFRPQEQRR